MKKTPMPGYGIAVIDDSQFSNVDYQGDDKFDTPQTGKLIHLREEDKTRKVNEYSNLTFGDLLDKTIYWAKYVDQDGTFSEETLSKDVAFIKLEKILGYDNE